MHAWFTGSALKADDERALYVVTAKLSCAVDASRPLRAPQDEGGRGVQRLAFLVTFAAIGTAKQHGDLCA